LTAPEAHAAFHPEDIARSAIDRQLAACGRVVQSRADMNVGVSQGVAVREFQTDSGPVDYALFIDRRLRGVIEAKAEGVTLSAFSEQAERYIAGVLADIVMLVRYAIGEAETLEPLPSIVAGRFNLWLGREEKAGRAYSDEQKAWLAAIRDHLAVNVEATMDDIMDAPDFGARGGLLRARALFGARLPKLLEELTDALVA
jgi:hypothetical protein